ncbi:MAG: response regulator [Bacteroidales bacterium]|nr:response regulator [Bacteroidales bacterium]
MRFRAVMYGLSLSAPLISTGFVHAQPIAVTPVDSYRIARELITEGNFDLAAEQLKAFQALNPTDADFLAIQQQYGPTVFERLRLIPVWSDNAQAQADAVKVVDALIAKSREAAAKVHRDPARIARFVQNLGASREERMYAEDQLRKAGAAVVPPMVSALLTTDDSNLRTGILGAVRRLGMETVPGFLAAVEGLPDELKGNLLESLASRPDILTQATYAETTPLPWLWYYASSPSGQMPFVRNAATEILRRLVGTAVKTTAADELVVLARPFVDHTARFAEFDKLPDKVQVWRWDAPSRTVKPTDTTKAQAEEYYGLRNLRWAIEREPTHATARELFVSLAAERSVIRNRFGVISRNDPPVYQLLAATPTHALVRLLDSAMAEKRTAVVFALTQALADRADPTTARPTEITGADGKTLRKEPVLSRALDYPDPRVQLAAAVGLLRAPGSPTHNRQARIVEVLRRAISADSPAPGTTDVGRALIADPSDFRAEKLAGYLRGLGYTVERTTTGRALLRRVAASSDFDVIIVDNHIGGLQLSDTISQLQANANVGGRPIMVVASSDQPRPVPFEYQLARLAALIAATETAEITITTPFAFDPKKPPILDLDQTRSDIRRTRDNELRSLYDLRLARLNRLVESVSFPISPKLKQRLDLRLPQLTYAMLAAEYPVSMESAPNTYQALLSLTDRIRKQSELTLSTERVPTESLARMIEQLNLSLDTGRLKKLETIRSRVTPEMLVLPTDSSRDVILEDRLSRLFADQRNVFVVPESFTAEGFHTDLASAIQDPARAPRDPAEKRAATVIALDWLAKIALGQIPGYDARPAEAALRPLMTDTELGQTAVDAVATFPTATAQQDLVATAIAGMLPIPLRTRAADRAILHIQKHGKFVPRNQLQALNAAAQTEADGVLKGKLLVIHGLIAGLTNDLPPLIEKFQVPLADPMPAEPAPMPKP